MQDFNTCIYYVKTGLLQLSLIWASTGSFNKLQLVQTFAARLLTGTRKHEHLRSLLWLPIPERTDFKLLLLTFKSLNDVAKPYMEELLVPTRPTRTLRSGD